MDAAPSAEPTMSRTRLYTYLTSLTAALALSVAPRLGAQTLRETGDGLRRAADQDGSGDEVSYSFKSRADSLAWSKNRSLAAKSTGFRLVVSLQDRHLWAIVGKDTVLSAPAAVAKGTTLEYGKSEWKFVTPRGTRTVIGKAADPVWQPPEWLYAETAKENDLKLGHIYRGKPVKLDDGRKLT